jgi:hypothetical protein
MTAGVGGFLGAGEPKAAADKAGRWDSPAAPRLRLAADTQDLVSLQVYSGQLWSLVGTAFLLSATCIQLNLR